MNEMRALLGNDGATENATVSTVTSHEEWNEKTVFAQVCLHYIYTYIYIFRIYFNMYIFIYRYFYAYTYIGILYSCICI